MCQSVVAAIEVPEGRRQTLVINAGNLADTGVETYRFEPAGGEPGALVKQRCKMGCQSAPNASGRGKVG